jgi:DNA-binding YbaB/EbfC family protein
MSLSRNSKIEKKAQTAGPIRANIALTVSLHSRSLPVTMIQQPQEPKPTNSKEVSAMKFPGGLNIQQMMKQAQVMQEKMQKEMEELRTQASAGGGVVTVEMKGNHEITSLKIDPEAVKEGDVEMLQDMILAAVNEANRKVDEAMKGKLGGMLPPGLGGLLG